MTGQAQLLRVGLAGCGAFANAALVPAMRYAPIQLAAVCDPDLERANATAAANGVPTVHASLDDMLMAGNLDAVIMAIGPHLYPKLASQALASGVDVFVEKPAALSVAEAHQMRSAAEKANKSLSVGFMKRFATGYRMARELSETEEFGQVKHISAKITTGVWKPVWSEKLDPFALVMDHSIHFLDLVHYFAGPSEWVTAVPLRAGGDRLGFAVVIQFQNGATGLLEISNFESRGVPNERVQLIGDRGHTVTVENVSRVTYGRDADPMTPNRSFDLNSERLVWEPNMTNISLENSSTVHMGYAGEMRHFADCLLNGSRPKPDIDNAIGALALAQAILTSDGNKTPVETGQG